MTAMHRGFRSLEEENDLFCSEKRYSQHFNDDILKIASLESSSKGTESIELITDYIPAN